MAGTTDQAGAPNGLVSLLEQPHQPRRIYASLARRVPSIELIDAVGGPGAGAQLAGSVWRDLVNRWRGGGSHS